MENYLNFFRKREKDKKNVTMLPPSLQYEDQKLK